MGYLDNYKSVRNRFKNYLSGNQTKKLLDLSKRYSRQNSFNRMQAASQLQTGFKQGFNGLRNVGMQNSGEVERLKKRLNAGFDYQNQQLLKNEGEALREQGQAMKRATIRARNARLPELTAKRMQASSGQRGMTGGAGRMLKESW